MKKLGKFMTFGGILTFIVTFVVVAKHQDAVYASIMSFRPVPTFSPFVQMVCKNQNALLVISIALFVIGLILWIVNRKK